MSIWQLVEQESDTQWEFRTGIGYRVLSGKSVSQESRETSASVHPAIGLTEIKQNRIPSGNDEHESDDGYPVGMSISQESRETSASVHPTR